MTAETAQTQNPNVHQFINPDRQAIDALPQEIKDVFNHDELEALTLNGILTLAHKRMRQNVRTATNQARSGRSKFNSAVDGPILRGLLYTYINDNHLNSNHRYSRADKDRIRAIWDAIPNRPTLTDAMIRDTANTLDDTIPPPPEPRPKPPHFETFTWYNSMSYDIISQINTEPELCQIGHNLTRCVNALLPDGRQKLIISEGIDRAFYYWNEREGPKDEDIKRFADALAYEYMSLKYEYERINQ
jgi:hypothetical protein